MILIVSTSGDLHALAIAQELKRREGQRFGILAVDQVGSTQTISLGLNAEGVRGELRFPFGHLPAQLADVRTIWWRRPFAQQLEPRYEEREQRFIDEECRAAFWGALVTTFRGVWVSTPESTLRSANKLLQLSVAQAAGFRVPHTIISQSKADVTMFYELCRGDVIVKPLVGVKSPMLFTRRLDDPSAFDDHDYAVCPALYQELIPGTRHMRLNCFGDKAFAAIIESEALDWRPDLNVPVYPCTVPRDLHMKATAVLKLLQLEMGVFDLKETTEGEWVWLEVNPQGQFLFLEPLTKLTLTEYFTDFLISRSDGESILTT